MARCTADKSSRSRAARSKSRASDASAISRSRRLMSGFVRPDMNSQKSSTIFRCCSSETHPTHGAEHFPMYANRHGRPVRCARRNTAAEHVRAGKTRSSRSSVSRMAHACAYGPKYLTPFLCGPRVTCSRGNCSPTVTASSGYDLSSRNFTLNRGSNSLIQLNSSCSASTSVPTTVHSTDAAVVTICAVRGCRPDRSAKYEFRRWRRLFALPT